MGSLSYAWISQVDDYFGTMRRGNRRAFVRRPISGLCDDSQYYEGGDFEGLVWRRVAARTDRQAARD